MVPVFRDAQAGKQGSESQCPRRVSESRRTLHFRVPKPVSLQGLPRSAGGEPGRGARGDCEHPRLPSAPAWPRRAPGGPPPAHDGSAGRVSLPGGSATGVWAAKWGRRPARTVSFPSASPLWKSPTTNPTSAPKPASVGSFPGLTSPARGPQFPFLFSFLGQNRVEAAPGRWPRGRRAEVGRGQRGARGASPGGGVGWGRSGGRERREAQGPPGSEEARPGRARPGGGGSGGAEGSGG